MTIKPKRIQRKRTKGWRMPPNTVYVGRPAKWCNSFIKQKGWTSAELMDIFKINLSDHEIEEAKQELKGKNLCCWCPLDQPCHADVLLKIANK